MADQAPRFRIELVALPDATPAVVRLRAWLKRGLRAFKLKCVEAREGTGVDGATAPPSAQQEGTAP
jgi:hypothetical protein